MIASQPRAPLVTVGLPVYNAAKTLQTAIDSVLAQSFEDWELIIWDDGSCDGSWEVAGRRSDSRIRRRRFPTRRGLPSVLNAIASEARGTLLARFDADDLMHPERLEVQVTLILSNSDHVDVVATDAIVIDETGRPTGKRRSGGMPDDLHQLWVNVPALHPTLLGTRKWFLSNPYSTRYDRAEDYELWLRTAGHTRLRTIPEPLYFYRWPSVLRLGPYCQTQISRLRLLWSNTVPAAVSLPVYTRLASSMKIFGRLALVGVTSRIGGNYLNRVWNAPLSVTEQEEALQVISDILSRSARSAASKE